MRVDTHWLRKANRQRITTSVALGTANRIFLMHCALSYRFSIPAAGNRQDRDGTPSRRQRERASRLGVSASGGDRLQRDSGETKRLSRYSRTQEMRSLNLSFGKRGFSKPLKYSFNTPATEFMSWLLSSSISGSLPGQPAETVKSPGRSTAARSDGDLSPLSKQFLMSLTSTCDPETRKIP